MGDSKARRFWGWGYETEGPGPEEIAAAEAGLRHFLGVGPLEPRARPRLEAIALPPPRLSVPAELSGVLSGAPADRAAHCYGKSYRDLVRAVAGDFSAPPDLVALPADESDVVRVLEYCDAHNAAVIPYGGGTSVCGGVEPAVGPAFDAAVTLDLRRLARVLEVDERGRAARIQAGVLGPALEDQLRPSGLTLRHFPQSFEFSSLGGWIATRAGGHYATLHTHIDDFVEALRVVTPAGVVETRRLPGSGAGPDPNRLWIGSEGTLGIITEAWMRLQVRPCYRARFTARFPDWLAGARAVRALAQSGLHPANCRLLDPMEALMNGAAAGDAALLIVGFESADHSVDGLAERAHQLVRDLGGVAGAMKSKNASTASKAADAPADAWRSAFLRAPYLRDELVLRQLFVETFETAVTWDRFDALVDAVLEAARAACRETGGAGIATCRITHAYPDGAAPYFTVIGPAVRGGELVQWEHIKRAMTEVMLRNGGTTTHHHAVGRDFRPYYEHESPPLFARALHAAKAVLDPAGRMNPGALLPAPGARPV